MIFRERQRQEEQEYARTPSGTEATDGHCGESSRVSVLFEFRTHADGW